MHNELLGTGRACRHDPLEVSFIHAGRLHRRVPDFPELVHVRHQRLQEVEHLLVAEQLADLERVAARDLLDALEHVLEDRHAVLFGDFELLLDVDAKLLEPLDRLGRRQLQEEVLHVVGGDGRICCALHGDLQGSRQLGNRIDPVHAERLCRCGQHREILRHVLQLETAILAGLRHGVESELQLLDRHAQIVEHGVAGRRHVLHLGLRSCGRHAHGTKGCHALLGREPLADEILQRGQKLAGGLVDLRPERAQIGLNFLEIVAKDAGDIAEIDEPVLKGGQPLQRRGKRQRQPDSAHQPTPRARQGGFRILRCLFDMIDRETLSDRGREATGHLAAKFVHLLADAVQRLADFPGRDAYLVDQADEERNVHQASSPAARIRLRLEAGLRSSFFTACRMALTMRRLSPTALAMSLGSFPASAISATCRP